MKTLCILLLAVSFISFAQQDITIEFNSKILSESRSISIHVPENYQTSKKSYPVIYALDGEYTKLTLNGTFDYYSYWDKIPECIVVSIDQNYLDTAENSFKRWTDCSYSWKSGFPSEKGALFKDFISKELIPFIDSSYRTTSFRTIVGHSYTANYVNYFLLDDTPLFKGYIAISPYYAVNGLDSLKSVIQNLKTPLFYFVADAENDLSGHIKSVDNFDKTFSKIENENFIYAKYDIKNNQATHSTIFPIALPYAVEHLFSYYSPISEKEFKRILKIDNKINYLTERYSNMKRIYGIEIPISETDIGTVSYAISKKKQWIQLKEIGELTIKLYPDSFLGYYTLGEYHEIKKDYSSALQHYEKGISKLGDDVTNISDFQKDIDRVKDKIK
ncbi:MAG TPA: alpha/beta hydrolase-fold protein [Brumimicrobium sp.]|nr:alpha/beta hydrolase-fold protein [Brumimicrobium sp.]